MNRPRLLIICALFLALGLVSTMPSAHAVGGNTYFTGPADAYNVTEVAFNL